MSGSSRSPARRAATRLLERASDKRWDVRAHMLADVVDQHGPTAALNWFASNMPTYDAMLENWGPLRTNYLAVAVSATNGCSYSTYSHGYAFVLHYFAQTSELFPLSEYDMRDLATRHENEIAEVLETALVQTGMATEVPWLQRILTLQQALRHGRVRPSTQDEKWMYHMIKMFAFLNACSMQANTEPDEAHDAINKDIDLRQRYQNTRELDLR